MTPHLRQRLLRAGFVRAIATADEKTAMTFSRRLRASVPATSVLLAAYERASNAEARRFEAVWTLLKLPGLQPEFRAGFDRPEEVSKLSPYRDNWWCGEPPDEKPVSPPAWITQEELTQARKEQAAAGGTLPFVTPIVVAWAKRHASDPRAPEALAMVVRASRYGCRDAQTGRFSNEAFALLHRQFPDSRWAKQTPYWYEGQ